MNTGLSFTVQAANKVAELIREENNPGLNLRVYVVGGGCSGLQYGFTFDLNQNPDDTLITQTCTDGSPVNLLIDSLSFPYLKNAEIDYTEGLSGAQFVIRNPDAVTTCGCGSSFSVKDDEDEFN